MCADPDEPEDPDESGHLTFYLLFCITFGLGLILSQYIGAYLWGTPFDRICLGCW